MPTSQAICRRCGHENRASARFCGGCGHPLEAEVVCSSCGVANPAGQPFCDSCGARLSGAAAPTTDGRRGRGDPDRLGGGRYEVVRPLGEGALKRVYLATDTRLDREVAVGVYKSEELDDQAMRRARREAQAMAKLGDHSNVVAVTDIGEEDGRLYLVSQYMPGGDLSTLLEEAEGRRLAVEEVLRLASDIARGLEHIHANGLVHRDLKPQNVWLAPDGTAKIGDFGLALGAEQSRITADGMMIGTVAYMSPEQGLGREADARSDLYSLGVVTYEMLCGTAPFVGEGAAAVISQHVSGVPVAPGWHRPDIPKALEQLVLKLLAKTPGERPESASDTLAALREMASVSTSDLPAAAATGAIERIGEGAFIGRERETRELRAAVDEALAGRGRIHMISGEAGIGKTALLHQAEVYAELRGATVIAGRCYEGEGAPAYWPWIQAIRSYVHDREPETLASELGTGASDIAQIVTEVRERIPDLPEPQAMDAEQARFRLFDSIATFLTNGSASKPLAIFLDDMHLADAPSIALLRFLAQQLGSSRMCLLCAYRDTELEADHPLNELHKSLSREPNYARAPLRGLSEEQVKALLEAFSEQALGTTDELAMVHAIYRESDGNPYFIQEIARHLVETGKIYRRDDGRWVSDIRRVEDLEIPQGIRDVVDRRLRLLPPECRELLEAASVIGTEFPASLLEVVTGLDATAVMHRLQEAKAAAILKQASDDPNRYEFASTASRDALHEELPQPRRVELHKAVGEALEELYGDRVEPHLGELARHFAEAAPVGEAERAAEYSWWAGEHAESLLAYEDAVEHYTRALRLFENLPDDPARRCELLLAVGDARTRAGDVAGGREAFGEAAELARHLSLPEQFARAALGYGGGPGGFSVTDRADDHLVALLRAALEGLPDRDSPLRARVMARLAVELYFADDPGECDELSRSAVEMAERIGDPKVLLLALFSREWATMGPDDPGDAVRQAEEVIRIAKIVGDREMQFQGHHLRLVALMQLGDFAEVDHSIRACEALVKEIRQPTYRWQVMVFRAMRALVQGRFAEGERLAQRAVALGQRAHGEAVAVVFGAHAFLAHWGSGTLDVLEEGGGQFAGRYPNSAWPAAFTWLLSEVERREKAQAAFEDLSRDGFASIRQDANYLVAVACLAMSCRYLEDSDSANVLYEMLEPYADHMVPILAGAACAGSCQVFLGMLAVAAGDEGRAAEHFERGLEANERIGSRYFEPRVCSQLAETLLALDRPGDRERASELIERGLETARRQRMPAETRRLIALRLDLQGIGEIDTQGSIAVVARSVEEQRPDLGSAAAPDGTVTILFSDIEGSTMLTEQLGDQRWLEVLHRHNEIVRRNVERHAGFEVKSQGDGFMLAFASARRAIQCAIDIQRDFAAVREEQNGVPLRVRIGLHTGEVIREEADFYGKNVVLAARIAASARGDEILVSSLLRELVASSQEFDFSEPRDAELKGITGRHLLFEVRWAKPPELRTETAAATASGGQAESAAPPS